ncbi:iron ABC transporter permease [Agrobacterium vitis]|uniref:Iron chelate uptake ABC transporter family permease subunit n=1 Tax=Agrobacterium vitis TaxID=373 RepID=A0AAE5AX10_AGRVI|nr:iron ABC transporter permease [Agrobacterium vitis]MCF1499960.1 iron ABC transporter permease [Allorhizobium sp. Av2]MCM2442355.1 iron ABC transporter permease [Agrobacterium vitis]MUZ58765.1 iron chelate uptake ABC transporter family permease subunit [Agrobacterium vitis]MVA66400.1 iron chelate uptake ABC transporter family permease subunit [Agrobacterium vitis]MVA88437.1 iron chelate uptake ABC transporter family permease subunit [Agrobacterium vitis]
MTSFSTEIEGMRDGYRRASARRTFVLIAALLCLVLLMVLDLTTGPSGMPLAEVWHGLLAGPAGDDRMVATILWQLRMPQTVMGVLVGTCLGLAGLQMQTILGNPLASPFTLGFSAAAGFGAALAIMFGSLIPLPGFIVIPACAFVMTLVACALVYLIARLRGATPEILVLGGIAVLFFFQSLQSLLQFLASPEVLQQIVFWLFGSLLKSSWTSVTVSAAIACACLPFIARSTWALTTLRLGDANARSLGLSVEKIRRNTFLIVALLTAGAVSFVGTIGFVGLIAPHVARALVGEDHRFSLPLAALTGAIILIGACVFGKFISPAAVIPVGIITAIAGVPMLFVVIAKRGQRGLT